MVKKDKHGMPTINGKPVTRIRIPKLESKEDLKEDLKTLYHGQIGYIPGNEIESFSFNLNPYIYLTDNYKYALHYARDGGIYNVEINTNSFLDCRDLGGSEIHFARVENFLRRKNISIYC